MAKLLGPCGIFITLPQEGSTLTVLTGYSTMKSGQRGAFHHECPKQVEIYSRVKHLAVLLEDSPNTAVSST